MLYKEWLEDCLENYVVPSSKDKTINRYTEIVQQHLIPNLGEKELSELNPLLVQHYITELIQAGNLRTGKGLAANSVNAIITVIQGSLETAYVLGLIEKYEMQKLKRPKQRKSRLNVLLLRNKKYLKKQ